jgi:hypothetical protein
MRAPSTGRLIRPFALQETRHFLPFVVVFLRFGFGLVADVAPT